MNKVQLVIHLRSGQFYDVTDYVSYVKISGATNTETRTLETEFISNYNDFQVSQINTQTGSSMCFYENGKELYRGNIVDMEKSSGGRTRVTCKDLGFSLSRAKVSKNYKDVKAEDIAKQICKEVRLPQGNFAKTNTKVTRYFRDVSAYDVIMTLYTLASEKTKKQYELEVNINKIEVVERGAVATIKFGYGDNLYSNTVHESIEDIINNVKVYDKNGNLVNEFMNKELYKIYNRMSNAVIEIERADMISMEAVKEAYKGEDRTIKISGVGNYDCRSGKRIYVDDVASNMRGEFYIDSDSHEWSGGTYKCDLELNMTNIMNKKEQGTEELEKEETKLEGFELQMPSGQAGAKDWGHGVTVAQLNKTLRGDCAGYGETVMKYSNMYKVNPAFIVGVIITECGGSPSKPNKKNNPLSNLYGGTYSPYDTMDQGIKAGIRNWSLNYISKTGKYNKGSTTIEQFARTYCPATAAQWARDVRAVIKKTVGKSDVNLGTGVKSDAEANANLVQAPPNTQSQSGGVPGQVMQARKHVGKKIAQMRQYKGAWNSGRWCADFVSFCLRESGKLEFGWQSSCIGTHAMYSKQGRANRNRGYIPKSGDLIFFKNAWEHSRWTNHIGIVESVGNGKITTLEGNSGAGNDANRRVMRNTYNIGARSIVGYAFPK